MTPGLGEGANAITKGIAVNMVCDVGNHSPFYFIICMKKMDLV